jgi:hypothetical protein
MIKINKRTPGKSGKLPEIIGKPPQPEGWCNIRACGVDWLPPHSPIPRSILGLEPVYTRLAGAYSGSETDEWFIFFKPFNP